MSDKTFYVTTPIYYVNARPHIGHAYTTIVADVLARRHRLLGDDTFFLTGTDEHGQKIERSAAAAGIPPQQFADQVSKSFEDLWKRMGILRDTGDPLYQQDYIRTTDPRHKRGVQKLFSELYSRGFIELRTYTGQYCVSDEAFVDVAPGAPCPDCGRITETLSEENFFFKLSEFQADLIDLLHPGPHGEPARLVITPDSSRNEVLSFIRGDFRQLIVEFRNRELDELTPDSPYGIGPLTNQDIDRVLDKAVDAGEASKTKSGHHYIPGALRDLSISRSSFTWGVPVPEPAASTAKQPHVIYVWLDALANYMTALGYGSDDTILFDKFWPANLHLVGKEITRFHCVYWPAFLLAAELPLPKQITANGWLLFDNSKMSKSKGNIVRTETILDAFGNIVYASVFPNSTHAEQDLFASDVLRYFLLREVPFGQDGTFSFDALITRYNADLANGYGNLVSRTLNMILRYRGSVIPSADLTDLDTLQFGRPGFFPHYFPLIEQQYGGQLLTAATNNIANLVEFADQAISRNEPWKLAAQADDGSQQKLSNILYFSAEMIRLITALFYPILPFATAKVWAQLGLGDIEAAARNGELNNLEWGGLKPGTKLGPLGPIFPRADKGLAQIMSDMENPTPVDTNPTDPAAAPPTTAPDAAPRTTTLDPVPVLPVGGSSALTTGPSDIVSHTHAHASGIFAAQPPAPPATDTGEQTPQITIDDFAKVELRVAQIVVAERIPKADKLLRLEVDLGEFGKRQILSGIAEWYAPEDLIGRRIVVITNLAPRKMRGLESHGMLLAASHGEGGKPVLATFGEDIVLGSRLK